MAGKLTKAQEHTDPGELYWYQPFSVYDPEPDNHHSPLYLVFPDGLMANVSGDDRKGVDIRRAHWMVSVLNAALAREGR